MLRPFAGLPEASANLQRPFADVQKGFASLRKEVAGLQKGFAELWKALAKDANRGSLFFFTIILTALFTINAEYSIN